MTKRFQVEFPESLLEELRTEAEEQDVTFIHLLRTYAKLGLELSKSKNEHNVLDVTVHKSKNDEKRYLFFL